MGEPAQALIEQAVADVTAVQASNDAAIDVTAVESADVTDVTGVADLVGRAKLVGGEDDDGAPTVAFPALEQRPQFVVYDGWVRVEGVAGRKWRPGVYWHGAQRLKEIGQVAVDTWICSPLNVEAITSDSQDNNFGRLLRFRNSVGRWRTWAMPMELLRGSGEELRGELLAMGLEIDPKGRQLLGAYLQTRPPKKRVRCALQVGWCEDVFVLPDTVIGPAADTVIFQSGERFHDEHGCLGSLADWRAQIAARAVGNPLLMVALSAAFAGPLLAK
jgi:putative DNA primase/helicase